MRLQDKVIFITGGAKGIGGAAAKICAGYGAKIAAVDLNEERLKQTVGEINEAGGYAIHPGYIVTDILRESFTNRGKAEGKNVEEFYKEMEATIPMGYIGQPEEIGELVAFLCDDRSAYINGNSILMAGGKIMA